ncbi:MAG: hypothetical protein P1U57_11745 [Oleibacter sp.]|nr:hypothetical protein [Thalassolituus sp.]
MNLSKRFVIAAILLASQCCFAETVNENVSQSILRLSGMTGTAYQVIDFVQSEITKVSLSDSALRGLNKSLRAWHPARIENQWLAILDRYSVAERQQLLETLQHPLLARQRDLEQACLESASTCVATEIPSIERSTYIIALDEAMQFSHWLTEARGASYTMLLNDLELWKPPQQWRQSIRVQSTNFLDNSTRSLSLDDLRELIRLWSLPIMQRWLSEAQAALPAR